MANFTVMLLLLSIAKAAVLSSVSTWQLVAGVLAGSTSMYYLGTHCYTCVLRYAALGHCPESLNRSFCASFCLLSSILSHFVSIHAYTHLDIQKHTVGSSEVRRH